MAEAREEIQALAEDLRRRRDELQVRLHLLKSETRDEWEALEKTWGHFQARLEVIGREAGTVAKDVGEALKLAGTELKEGYERIRRLV